MVRRSDQDQSLSSTSDESRLARQEPYWLERKQEFFTANRLGGEGSTNTISLIVKSKLTCQLVC